MVKIETSKGWNAFIALRASIEIRHKVVLNVNFLDQTATDVIFEYAPIRQEWLRFKHPECG